MNKLSALCTGACVGAGLMYLFDPVQGRRRRAQVRDKTFSLAHKAECAMNIIAEDFQNRVNGFVAEGNSWLHPKEITDDVLVSRIRTKLGRYVSHPRNIEVACVNGAVTLSGLILAAEVPALISALNHMSGVKHLINHLEIHKNADESPRLQGGCARTGEKFDLFQPHWSPATRALVGVVGALSCAIGARKGGIEGAALLITGIGMISEAASNKDLRHILSMTEQQPNRRMNHRPASKKTETETTPTRTAEVHLM